MLSFINFVDLESLMLRAKFQDRQTSGSEKEFVFLPYMVMVVIWVM